MIYKFRMISSDERAFMRDYEIQADALFVDFHKLIQSDLHFDEGQLASFFITDDHWNKGIELTLIDMGAAHAMPMDTVRLSDMLKCRTDRLLYVYDIFADQHLFIELIDIHEPQPHINYPRCSAAVGDAPEQQSPDDFDDADLAEDLVDEDEFGSDDFGLDGEDLESLDFIGDSDFM